MPAVHSFIFRNAKALKNKFFYFRTHFSPWHKAFFYEHAFTIIWTVTECNYTKINILFIPNCFIQAKPSNRPIRLISQLTN